MIGSRIGEARARAGNGLHDTISVNCASCRFDADRAISLLDDSGDLGADVNLDSKPGRGGGIAPGDCIVPHDSARRVVERAENGIANIL